MANFNNHPQPGAAATKGRGEKRQPQIFADFRRLLGKRRRLILSGICVHLCPKSADKPPENSLQEKFSIVGV